MKTLFCSLAFLTTTSLFAQSKATSNPPEFFQDNQKISASIYDTVIQRNTNLGMEIKGSHWVNLVFYTSKWDIISTSGWLKSEASLIIPVSDKTPGSYITACYEVKNDQGVRNSAEEGCLVIDIIGSGYTAKDEKPLGEKSSTVEVKIENGKLQKASGKVGKLSSPDNSVNQD